jgi:hypothetical protein
LDELKAACRAKDASDQGDTDALHFQRRYRCVTLSKEIQMRYKKTNAGNIIKFDFKAINSYLNLFDINSVSTLLSFSTASLF